MKMKYEVIFKDFRTDDVYGAVTEIRPDNYLIIINSRLSEEEQAETLKHELYHIEHGHLHLKNPDVNELERITNKAIDEGWTPKDVDILW